MLVARIRISTPYQQLDTVLPRLPYFPYKGPAKLEMEGNNMNDTYNSLYNEEFSLYDNCTTGLSEESKKSIETATLVFYCITCFLGVPGNALVIWIAGVKMKKTVNTIWFLNLAITDFLCCLSIPFTMAEILLEHHWPYGDAMCKVIPTVIVVNMFTSIFTLNLISLDRFIQVVKPVWAQNNRTARLAWICCALAWALAILLSLPTMILRETVTLDDFSLTLCIFSGTNIEDDCSIDKGGSYRALTMARFALGFLLPLLCIVFCYTGLPQQTNWSTHQLGTGFTLDALPDATLPFFHAWARHCIQWLGFGRDLNLGLPYDRVHQLLALVNRYSSPGRLHYTPQFLSISWFCLRNRIFDVTLQVFYWIKVWGLGWPLHNVNLVGLEPRCCSLTGNNMNNTYNNYDNYMNFIFEPGLSEESNESIKTAALVFLGITCFLGVPGNGLVVWIAGVKMKKTVNTIWFLNLAIADLLFCLFIPFTMVEIFLERHWPYGDAMCKVLPMIADCNMFASIFTLSLLSLDRFIQIVKPVWARNSRTVRLAWICCALAWALAVLLSLPNMILRKTLTETTDTLKKTFCIVINATNVKWLIIAWFVLGFLLPLLCIVFCYTGKGRELADMMERRKVDILCVQETRWKGSKARSIGAGFKLFYYGVDSKRNGVGVVLKEEFVRNVLEVKRVSDRVMSLKLEIEGVTLNVVSGYAPQVGCELEEKFWSELDEVMESIPTGERVVIGADFNGHVGEGNTGDEEVMGKFGVKERNLDGQMVVDFAKRMDMAVVQ
ncbi:hypothetical protein QTP86_001245 [Hemibagrus guttatus]|nr:hypothetical protein QTP86_001245 [Hemibagrus guttatus]